MKASTTWRTSSAIWLIALLPLLLKLPVLTGHLTIDPMVFTADIGDIINFHGSYPWIDPNVGFQAQALGKLSADTLLHGHMPWWNPYNGVGLPLAAEAQPGSLFLPFVLLHHFQSGFMWVQIILQIMAGLSTYALLRKLGLTELASLTGGLLYELNGTFAWLGLPITAPIAFLPMLLLGTESLLRRLNEDKAGGWLLVPVALAWSIYSGFPETAYIDGLFVALWVLFRLPDVKAGARLAYVRKLVFAVAIGVACGMLQILPFAHYVSLSDVGGHDGSFPYVGLSPDAASLTLIPRLFGPIFRFNDPAGVIGPVWGSIGGYLPALQLVMIFLAIQLRPKRLALVPFAWMVLCFCRTFDIGPISHALGVIPLMNRVAFYRYAAPSWEFAGVLLVCICIDAVQRGALSKRRPIAIAAAATLLCLIGALRVAWPAILTLWADHASAHYVRMAGAWLILAMTVGLLALLTARRWIWAPRLLAAMLLVDATLTFAGPLQSGVSHVQSNHGGLNYLRQHVRLQRTFTLGPLAPNYGAYFRIAQINHNYLPVSADWTKYVQRRLDPGAIAMLFTGGPLRVEGFGSPAEQLQMNLSSYEDVGVKYVLAPHGVDPIAKAIDMPADYDGYHAPLQLGTKSPVVLHWQIPAQAYARNIRAVSVTLGNYGGRSDGQLDVQVCLSDATCAQGHRALSESSDNVGFEVPLDRELVVTASPQGSAIPITLSFNQERQSYPVVLWINGVQQAHASEVSLEGYPKGTAPIISLFYTATAGEAASSRADYRLAYDGPDMSIYELPGAKPYFEASDRACSIQAVTSEHASVHCQSPAELLRREAFFPGWTATVNGDAVPVRRCGEIFQSVALRAGDNDVLFNYRPPHYELMLTIFFAGMFALLWAALQELARTLQSEYGAYFSGGALTEISEVNVAVSPWGEYASPPTELKN